MPPPRKSATRAGSATPARTTASARRTTPRASSVLPSESRRTNRVTATQGPSDGGQPSNPQLPDIQTQQSFAYGSQNTPFLPDKLVAKEKMTLQEMAETIDVGIRQAEQRFEAQNAEAEANFGRGAQKEARADRARRRSESREPSVTSSRKGSVDSQNTDTRTSRRTAAWADSVSNTDNLEVITEEMNLNGAVDEEMEDDFTRRGSDGPSSFPSGNFDISYNQERRQFKPLGTRTGLLNERYSPIKDGIKAVRAFSGRAWQSTKQSLSSSYQALPNLRPRRSAPSSARPSALRQSPAAAYDSRRTSPFEGALVPLVVILMTAAAWILVSMVFCSIYETYFCDYESSSIIRPEIRRFCGSCVPSFTSQNERPPTTSDGTIDTSAIFGSLNKRLSHVESRFDVKNSQLSKTLGQVTDQQHVLESIVSDLQRNQKDSPTQPRRIDKINYCSTGNGAVIDPYLTSPTQQKQFNYLQRVVIGSVGLQKYQSHPPSEALRYWEEVGDCWCAAAAGGYAQLGVLMSEIIYPTEVVIEHVPSDASPKPGTAPKDLEIWGDFSHLSPQQYVDAGLDKLPRDYTLPKMFVRIGKMAYQAGHGVRHVQTFKLDINQDAMIHSTQKVVFRAVSNYGAEHTCFYRVRVHGAPVVPHPQIKADGEVVV